MASERSEPSFATSQSQIVSKDILENLATQIAQQKQRIHELESLIKTISRGKYMWESTFDAITSPVTIVSSDFIIERANLEASRIAGVDVRNLIGKVCYETLAGFSSPCKGCPLLQAGASVRGTPLETFRKSGLEFEVTAYPLERGHQDESGSVVLHYQDITQQKKLRRQLLQSEKMAAIGTLAGGVAHEINNPLGGILAFAQLIMRELNEEHSCQSDLKEIENAALRCKRIVQDLLEFSRQNPEEEMEVISLNDAIRKTLPLIKVQVKMGRLALDLKLADELPQIFGNSHKLQQVFLNIVTNAAQAMGDLGRIDIKTFFDEARQRVGIEIADTGPGIPNENMNKIFDPYFTTKGQGEGTGLGLAISYSIIQEHNGDVTVKSELNKGTAFIMSFPIHRKS